LLLKNAKTEEGTVLLWSVGLFGVSLLVLGVLISVASYFSETRELQSQLEISATNSSDQLDFTDFYLSGNLENIIFDEASLLGGIGVEMSSYVRRHGNYSITYWRVDKREYWLEIAKTWQSPFGNFAVLPKVITASVHISLDENRHAQ
jgi:hypothetical protein